MSPPASAKAGPADTSWRQSRREEPPYPFVKDASPLEVPFATEQFKFLKYGLRHPHHSQQDPPPNNASPTRVGKQVSSHGRCDEIAR
jgi:hypothetical protein